MDTPSIFHDALSAQLRAEKAAAQLSLDELAEKSGVPRPTLQRYIAGERDIPSSRLDHIAHALGLTTSDLVARAEERITKPAD